jgi:hypothetical protein
VLAIAEQARQEFSHDAERSLELYRDPEVNDQYLTLYIRQTRYDADILARIHRVVEPFADQLAQASGYLLLTTDFRPPRGTHAV